MSTSIHQDKIIILEPSSFIWMIIIFFPFKNAKRSTNIQVSSFKLRNSYQSSFSCISGLRHPWSLHQGYDTLFLLHIGVMTPWSLHQGYDTLFLLHIGVTTLWSMHQGFDTLSTTSKLGLRHPAKVMTPYPYPPFFTTLSDRMVSDFFPPPWIRPGESIFFHFPYLGPLLGFGHLIPLN